MRDFSQCKDGINHQEGASAYSNDATIDFRQRKHGSQGQQIAPSKYSVIMVLGFISILMIGCIPNKAQTLRIEPAREYAD